MISRISRPLRLVRQLLLLLPACYLWGCSVNPALHIDEHGANLPDSALVTVPFHPQTALQCGPAALATVLGASGVEVDPEQLAPHVFIPERDGSLQVELMAATRTRGRIPFPLGVDVSELLEELAAGRPVLVMQNLGTRSTPIWHYAVLTGYQQSQNRFRLNSGKDKDLWLGAPAFLRTWDWAGRWAIVTLEPGQYPVRAPQTPDPIRYLRPVLDFENVAGITAAQPAWRAAALQWPNASLPALALGNIAYQTGKLEEAVRWYARGLATDGDNPALANNLASALGAAGCARGGEKILAEFAGNLQQDSPWAATIETTRAELAEQRMPDNERCAALVQPAES